MVLAAATLGASLLISGPAVAASLTVVDPPGDAEAGGLDITSATVDNRDKKIVVTLQFVESVRGDLVVSIDPEKARGLRIVSRYRPNGQTRSYVVTRAFTDKRGQARIVKCNALDVVWSEDAPTVTLRLPARCLADGDYEAVRGAFLTEDPDGSDTDYAPGDGESTPFIPRGEAVPS